MTEPKLTPIGSDPAEWSGTYITFDYAGLISPDAKTHVWEVYNTKGGGTIGYVKWFGRWRKYAFFPAPDCVFEEVCMREISMFIEDRTKEHRTGV